MIPSNAHIMGSQSCQSKVRYLAWKLSLNICHLWQLVMDWPVEWKALRVEVSISPSSPIIVPSSLFFPEFPLFISWGREFSVDCSWNMVQIPLYLEKHPWNLRYVVGTTWIRALTEYPSPSLLFFCAHLRSSEWC